MATLRCAAMADIAEPRSDDCGNAAEGDAARLGAQEISPEQGELLARLGIAMVESGSLAQMLPRLAEAARDLTGARYAAIGVVGADGRLTDFITSGVDRETTERIGALPRGRGLLGAIRAEKGTIRIDDIASDPRSAGFPPGHPVMTSFLGTPIRLADRHFGNIYVTDSPSGAFGGRDEQLIRALAAYAAVAIRGGELGQERQRWVDGLEGVCAIAASLSAPDRDLDQLLPEAARRARNLLGCDTVGIAIGSEGAVCVPYAFGRSALRLETAEDPASSAAFASCVAPLECLVSPFEDPDGGGIVVVTEGTAGRWQVEIAAILARHVGGAVAASRAAEKARLGLIAESEAHRRELSARLERQSQERALMAQEGERARVARELHDETGQLLTAISLRLKGLGQRLDDDALAAEVDDLRGHVREVQTSIRRFLQDLRPVNLEQGLGPAITELADQASRESSCTFESIVDPLPPIDGEIEVAVYRIAQEAVTNVVRHSGARRATVALVSADRRLRLSVEDDGRGFDTDAPRDGFGLSGIRERVELVGGTLRLDSSPDAGTAVIVDVALPATAAGS